MPPAPASPLVSQAALRDLHGPSVHAGFPSVLLEFESPRHGGFDAQGVLRALSEAGITIGSEDLQRFRSAGEALAARHLVASIARWLDARSRPAGAAP